MIAAVIIYNLSRRRLKFNECDKFKNHHRQSPLISSKIHQKEKRNLSNLKN